MDTIRLVSWNVNGFRALSGKPDWDWFASTDADVVALQETKAEPAQIAEEHRSPEGWNAEWLAAQVKKGYSGVAVFSRQKAALEPLAVHRELPDPLGPDPVEPHAQPGPAFGLDETTINGVKVAVEERVVWERPFCKLVYFDRKIQASRRKPQPKVLLVAPMSGHYATLLRGTVEAFLPGHEVYITDWTDARLVPLAEGRFDLDDYIDYVIGMLQMLGPDTHVMAICQPSVSALAAAAIMCGSPVPPHHTSILGLPASARICANTSPVLLRTMATSIPVSILKF